MNSLERISSVLKGEYPDRPPFGLLISLMGMKYANASPEQYYGDADIWLSGQKRLIKILDPDFVTGPFSFALEAEAFGCKTHYSPTNAPNVGQPYLIPGQDIEKIIIPDLTHPALSFILDANKGLVNEYGNSKAVAPLILSPADLPALLFGIEGWIDVLLFQRKWIEAVMERSMEHFVGMANYTLNHGASFVVTTANFLNPTIVTKQMFELILPYLQAAFERIKGPIVVHHGGCRLGDFITQYSRLPNVIGIVIDPRDSLEKARGQISPETILMGNLDGPKLGVMQPDRIMKRSQRILGYAKADPRFVFASSNADIPVETSLQKLKDLASLVKQFKIETD